MTPTLTFNELMYSAVSNHLSKLCTALVWKQKYCIPFHQMKKKNSSKKKKEEKRNLHADRWKPFDVYDGKKYLQQIFLLGLKVKLIIFKKNFQAKRRHFVPSLWHLACDDYDIFEKRFTHFLSRSFFKFSWFPVTSKYFFHKSSFFLSFPSFFVDVASNTFLDFLIFSGGVERKQVDIPVDTFA